MISQTTYDELKQIAATPETSAAVIPRISAQTSMPSAVTRPSALCTRCSMGSSPDRACG